MLNQISGKKFVSALSAGEYRSDINDQTVTGPTIDMDNHDSVMLLVLMGSMHANADFYIEPQVSHDGTNWLLISPSNWHDIPNNADDKWVIINIEKVAFRYIRFRFVEVRSEDVQINAAIAVLDHFHSTHEVTQDDSFVATTFFMSNPQLQ